jgi:hypothetical protein
LPAEHPEISTSEQTIMTTSRRRLERYIFTFVQNYMSKTRVDRRLFLLPNQAAQLQPGAD